MRDLFPNNLGDDISAFFTQKWHGFTSTCSDAANGAARDIDEFFRKQKRDLEDSWLSSNIVKFSTFVSHNRVYIFSTSIKLATIAILYVMSHESDFVMKGLRFLYILNDLQSSYGVIYRITDLWLSKNLQIKVSPIVTHFMIISTYFGVRIPLWYLTSFEESIFRTDLDVVRVLFLVAAAMISTTETFNYVKAVNFIPVKPTVEEEVTQDAFNLHYQDLNDEIEDWHDAVKWIGSIRNEIIYAHHRVSVSMQNSFTFSHAKASKMFSVYDGSDSEFFGDDATRLTRVRLKNSDEANVFYYKDPIYYVNMSRLNQTLREMLPAAGIPLTKAPQILINRFMSHSFHYYSPTITKVNLTLEFLQYIDKVAEERSQEEADSLLKGLLAMQLAHIKEKDGKYSDKIIDLVLQFIGTLLCGVGLQFLYNDYKQYKIHSVATDILKNYGSDIEYYARELNIMTSERNYFNFNDDKNHPLTHARQIFDHGMSFIDPNKDLTHHMTALNREVQKNIAKTR